MGNKPRIAVFASGNGSNFQAISDAVGSGELEAELVLAVTDKPGSFVMERAQKAGVETLAFKPSDFDSKQQYETMVKEKLMSSEVEWIVLAGYMRLIGATLLEAYENRIVNIHPSVLPSFPGKDAIGQTMSAGAEFAGATVHFVDAGMDTGAIIAQQSFRIGDLDKAAVEKKIHTIEHQLYPAALQQLLHR